MGPTFTGLQGAWRSPTIVPGEHPRTAVEEVAGTHHAPDAFHITGNAQFSTWSFTRAITGRGD
jgi:hypothetical protein